MIFTKLEALASRAVDRTFGERVRVETRADGRFVRQSADPERPAFETIAVIDLSPAVATVAASAAHPSSLSVDAVHVSFATSALSSTPRQGDRIVALERGHIFSISTVEPDGMGRVLCRCTPVSDAEGGG